MPRTNETTKSHVDGLCSRLEQIVAAARAEGREAALAEVRGLIGGGGAKNRGRPRADRASEPLGSAKASRVAKASKPRKSSWAGLTPEMRLARVNAIRKGRGLPPKQSL